MVSRGAWVVGGVMLFAVGVFGGAYVALSSVLVVADSPVVQAPVVEAPVVFNSDREVPVQLELQDLTVTHTVSPRMPREHIHLTPQTCKVDVDVQLDGSAGNLMIRGCDAPFSEAAAVAISQWMWDPYAPSGEPVVARTTVQLSFKSKG